MSSVRRNFFKQLGLLFTGGYFYTPRAAEADTLAESATTGIVAPSVRQQSPSQVSPTEESSELFKVSYDVVVVGGGIAGTTAAISAARNGVKVALVHERSMLGGNSSSEVKLFPEHNSGHQPWIKEGGIHDEFHTEERTRNHVSYQEGTMNCHWDLVLYEWAIREPNLTLYLNTHMHRAYMENSTRIQSVHAIQLGTEKEFELRVSIVRRCHRRRRPGISRKSRFPLGPRVSQ